MGNIFYIGLGGAQGSGEPEVGKPDFVHKAGNISSFKLIENGEQELGEQIGEQELGEQEVGKRVLDQLGSNWLEEGWRRRLNKLGRPGCLWQAEPGGSNGD